MCTENIQWVTLFIQYLQASVATPRLRAGRRLPASLQRIPAAFSPPPAAPDAPPAA